VTLAGETPHPHLLQQLLTTRRAAFLHHNPLLLRHHHEAAAAASTRATAWSELSHLPIIYIYATGTDKRGARGRKGTLHEQQTVRIEKKGIFNCRR